MKRFHVRDMVYSPQYGYGEVIELSAHNFPVRVKFSDNTIKLYSHNGNPYHPGDDKIVHSQERWKEEVNFALACLAFFVAGIICGGQLPWG